MFTYTDLSHTFAPGPVIAHKTGVTKQQTTMKRIKFVSIVLNHFTYI